ncbi:uncharacterized protein LOC132201165 [Neocloeon triangulifer]|uniref:uncharacterized protein LOC132201165 n=1 Tax=Neocloeon triangulifer TaxID=2078957 RepID=UPI00286FA8B7|nr:uncharacterized protein LOC132201165 [Neocloeon triangulifer]
MDSANEDDCEEVQRVRTEMREKFLRLMTALAGQKCEFSMLEKTNVRGELKGCDRDVLNLCVSNLETPLGVIPQAILRTEDIVSVKVSNFPVKDEN